MSDTALDQVAAAVDAVEVRGPTSFAWLGEPHDLPEPVRRLAPADGLRAALVQAIARRLYESFYTRGRPVARRPRPRRTPDSDLARALSAANAGTGAVEPGWRVAGDDAGRLVVERSGLRLWAEPGEVVHDAPGPPRVGDLVSLLIANEAPRSTPGFYMALSDRGLDLDRPRLLDNYYIHVRADAAVRFVELATTGLNAAGLPFRLKVLDDPAAYWRRDTALLALQRKDRAAALEHVEGLHSLLREGLDDSVPALTLPLAPGLAFAEDPGDGVSFGAQRCGLIAAALVEAHEAGFVDPGDRMEMVRVHMARVDTTPEAPYLGPHSAGRPTVRAEEATDLQEATP